MNIEIEPPQTGWFFDFGGKTEQISEKTTSRFGKKSKSKFEKRT
jgi:hypothetical protein